MSDSNNLGNVYDDNKSEPSAPAPKLGNVYFEAAGTPPAEKAPLQNFTDAFQALRQQLAAGPLNSALVEVINDVALSLAEGQQVDQLEKLTSSVTRITQKYR